jgi:2-polyprenyl-3-methyl-5-hydroxy-6-metoxy-1,4-benzoquinol methylase
LRCGHARLFDEGAGSKGHIDLAIQASGGLEGRGNPDQLHDAENIAMAGSFLEVYAENQRKQYDANSNTRERAEQQVAPNYENLRERAPKYVDLMLAEYSMRRGPVDINNLKFLDFGCGVGRVMEAIREMGGAVDGADISEEMLSQAKASQVLKGSNFYLTNGFDTGEAPKEAYDIVFSFLCIHHIPMRLTRLRIMESTMHCLKPGGMCFLELKYFPGATVSRIPHNHAAWTENRVAKETNSRADVWVTPDAMGLVFQDMSLFFKDIFMLEAEMGDDHFEYNPEAIYQYAFNPLFVGGFRSAALYSVLSKA